MIEMIKHLMLENLYLVVFLLILAENIFPPIPSELVLTYAGSLIIQGGYNIYLIILIVTLASLLSSVVFYIIGSKLSQEQIIKLNAKLGNFGFKQKDIEKSFLKFENHGSHYIFFSRLIPVMRTLISIPAGSIKFDFKKFIVLTFLGSLLWNSLLITLGFLFTDQITAIVGVFSIFEKVILVALIGYILYLLFKK